MKKLVLVIPTYNERGNIEALFSAFDRVVKKIPRGWKLEFLIVDDNSPDGTAAEVERVQQLYKSRTRELKSASIHLFNNPSKAGLGKAYLVGMEYAVNNLKADAIGQFDADLSHDPHKVPELLVKLDQGYDMVIGSRYIAGGSIPADWGRYRKMLSRVGNTLVRFGLGHPELNDWSTGFRIFTKKVYTKIKPNIKDEQFFGYLIMVGILHNTVKAGFKVTEVPFHFVDRTYGESKLGVEYIIDTLTYIATSRLTHMINTLKNSITIKPFSLQSK
jgi:dolichol-phosphate mannosyltransferase